MQALTAHFQQNTGPWRASCALVTTRIHGLPAPMFNVYLYKTDGMREQFVSEHLVSDVNIALEMAREFGHYPDTLEIIERETLESIVRWCAPRNGAK